jgi:hypothetical protein
MERITFISVTSYDKPESKRVTYPFASIIGARLGHPIRQLAKNADVDAGETLSKHLVIGGSVNGINEGRLVLADHPLGLGILNA